MHVKQISFGEDQLGPAAARGEFGNSRAVNGHPSGEGTPPEPSAVPAPGQPGKSRLGHCATISVSDTIGLATPARQGTFPLPWGVAGCKSGHGLIPAAQPPARLPHASPRGNREPASPQSIAGREAAPQGRKGSVTPQSVPVLLWDFGPS